MNTQIFFLFVLISISLTPFAYAEIEKGINYDRTVLHTFEDGVQSVEHKILSYDRVLSNGQYEDYVYSDLGNALEIKTASNMIRLDKSSCGFSYHGSNDVLKFKDSIIAFSSVVDLFSWNEVTQVNNALCEAYYSEGENALVAKRYAEGVGFMEYKYIFFDGKWKTQLEATNLTTLEDRVFGFDQTIDLNTDTVYFGGSQRNLDNFDGQTFNRTWLENNEENLINFLNDVKYDFDLGFDYLDSITVIDSGNNSSKLVFHFVRNNEILMPNETLIIDPTFSNSPSIGYTSFTYGGSNSDCEAMGWDYIDATNYMYYNVNPHTSGAGACGRSAVEFDITSLPSAINVTDADLDYEVTTQFTAIATNLRHIGIQPSSLSTTDDQDSEDLWNDIKNGTTYSTAYDESVGTHSLDLGTDAEADLNTYANDGSQDWFAIGIESTDYSRLGGSHKGHRDTTLDNWTLTVQYNFTIPQPNGVQDLTTTDIQDTFVDLSWSQPNLNTGNLSGYQINYTTPWGDPLTVLTNNTLTSDTTSRVSGLTQNTNYTFQIGVWTEGYNGTGNLLNVTTLEDFTLVNYTVGNFDFNATNDDIIQMFFERDDINATALFLNVTYPNTYDLACNFDYEFANISQNYTNLSNVTISATAIESSFLFNDVDNEIITVYCWDEGNEDNNGTYLITQTVIPLVTQIQGLQDGTYGTDGMIGILDIVTLFVVIFAFIGFNRVNEGVGAVFTLAILGVTSYYGIIQLESAIFGGIAIVAMLIFVTVRKQ